MSESEPYTAHLRAETADDGAFNSRLLRLMDRKKISSYRLAKALGVTGSAVSRWLSGDRAPDYERLKAIADVLQLTSGEKQWLFISLHYVIPEWEGIIHAHAREAMPEGPPVFASDSGE